MPLSGTADLPLHSGHVPEWLLDRMRKLASAIVEVIAEEYGPATLLLRLGDPLWFQSFGCVLGFDWHSSGLTTVVCGVLRDSLTFERHGVAAVGGKGLMARRIPKSLSSSGLDEGMVASLERASRLSAKVDNNALQDGYNIYHHTLFFTEGGDWTVVQQGLNTSLGYARRYHWIGRSVKTFVEEPHSGISGDRHEERVLNMVSRHSAEARKASLDLIAECPERLQRLVNMVHSHQTTLDPLGDKTLFNTTHISMPRKINWKVVRKLYDFRPASYEELIDFPGLGASTIRALALVASLVYGCQLDWRDPVKYSFAVGGKDGVPHPVSKRRMDEVTNFLAGVLEKVDVGRETRLQCLRKLHRLSEVLSS
ncbi:MAG: DUF763 domain-containing protein [Nitrososphaerota archaeon]